MKTISTFVLLTLLASCGNPHVSSSGGGLEETNPPLNPVQHGNGCGETDGGKNKLVMIRESVKLAKCKQITEKFTSFANGEVTQLSNHTAETHSYELVQVVEKEQPQDKMVTLSDVFADETIKMNIEANTLKLVAQPQTSLLWTYHQPIGSWGAKMSKNFAELKVRTFDCSGVLMKEFKVNGQDFVGVISHEKNICHVSLSSGAEALMVSEFSYGE